jgi:RNA polymerase sigma-70 factor (ECF subfamily)
MAMPLVTRFAVADDPPAASPDAADLVALRHGDPTALADCYHRHAAPLLTLARRLTGSDADAEDVVHDVFVGLPEALARYEERGQFGAWLTRVTMRVALMRQRSERRYTDEAEPDLVAAPTLDHDPLVRDTLHRALVSLSPALRHVFVLRALYDHSHAEIAAVLGISVSASEVRLHRAVQQLRSLLGSHH